MRRSRGRGSRRWGRRADRATSAKNPVRQPIDDEARALARRLVRTARFGALAVLEPGSGHPHASRAAVAPDIDGVPVMLLSSLSPHTAALDADPRCWQRLARRNATRSGT